jgi:signal transduction histidine kinase
VLSLGLFGRLVVILLLTVAVEFSASTLLYERASELSLQEDQAHRLAEHLEVSRKLLESRPSTQRMQIAEELGTDRYSIGWTETKPGSRTFAPPLASMQRQIIGWEPKLARTGLRLDLPAIANGSTVSGVLQLGDGSWMTFQMRGLTGGWQLSVGRVLRALIPAFLLLLFSALLIRSTLQPLRKLIHAAGQVGLGWREPLPETGTAEIKSLIHAFNEMHVRIHQLIESRTQALAAVSHDLRTPLARLQLRLDAIGDPRIGAELRNDINEMDEMIGSLLAFLGGDSDPEKPILVDLAVVAATLIDDAADRGEDARYIGPDHLETRLRVSAVRRAISNLIENALHYGGQARVRLEVSADDYVLLTVEDDGPGIPGDRLEEVLRPFFRLDESRARNTNGFGLGLAIVVGVVEAEGGTLTLSNRPEGGLSVTIRLPIAR